MSGTFERPTVRRAHGYVPGEQPEAAEVIKLNTNENPYPPAPALAEALARFDVAALRRYPPPTALGFRRAAAALHGVDPDCIVATNGGDELLRLALDTFVEPGERVGVASPSYSLYPVLSAVHGAELVEVPLAPDWSLPADLADRLNAAGAKLTFLVNPHAPSGRLTGADAIARLARALDGVLVLDEAYVDFVDPGRGYDAVPLVAELDNLLVLRTLSKGYSLAGLRFGYGIGAASLVAPVQTKTKDSYNTDTLSQVLATTALGARDYAEGTWAKVRAERARLVAGLGRLGMACAPSETNFVLAPVPETLAPASGPAAGPAASRVREALKEAGILVRWFDEPRLEDKLRITVGTPEENDALLAALTRVG